MERGVGSIWCLVLLIPGLLPGCWSQVTVVINSYTHNSTLIPGESVPLGKQFILVCRVVGLPYGTPLSYTWTCPNGPCEVEGYYGRKVYNKHILAINTTSTSDGGTYTCHVTATGGQEATGNFTFSVPVGLAVVHSYGRLIPCDFPITNLQQISGPDGIGRITCALNSGSTTIRHEATATLVLSLPDSLNNRDMYCLSTTNYFFFFPSPNSPLNVPRLTVNASRGIVKYRVERRDTATTRVITGYDMFRFGVQMIGRYANLGTGRSFTTGPAVPGAQYRITAWALGNGRRSTKPVVEGVTMGESTPSPPKLLSITRIMKAEIELNWLSPTEPNGEVHYVIYYTPEGGTEQSIDTGSDLTHYNLTGLERNRVYTDIAVRAVNAAGTSVSSTVILQYNHMPDGVPTAPQTVTTTRVFQDGVELNWLPPTEPNGEVHYVIYYTPEGGTERSVDTGSNLRHYNLTGLERNRVYTNISVQAVNIIGRSGRSTVIAQYNHTLPDAEVPIVDSSASSSGPLLPAVVSLGVVVLLLITCVALLALALAVTATKLNKLRAEKAHTDPLYYYNQTGGGEETKDRIYDEVGEGTEERRHYHELNQETMEKRQYKTLHGEDYRC